MKLGGRQIAVGFVCGLILGPATTARAQSEANLYSGAGSCARCHETPSATDVANGATQRECLNEWQTWKNADRHSVAYESLKGARGQRIGKLLGDKNVLAPATGCVQCHTTSYEAAACVIAPKDACVPEGVGCEACHGPSSRWWSKHLIFPNWRESDPQAKADMGWIDMRSAVARAEVCVSCHVGSAEYGRVITHDMYAAGHPPLAGFEIESFIDKMPRHWMHSNERAQPGGAAEATQPSFDRTRNVLVASVVSLRMAMELAVADATTPGAEPRWPELARMDCFACHHELAEPGWRQIRAASTAPGRPQFAVGCVPLVEVAGDVVGNGADEKVDAIMARLREPFATSVFGDPAALAEQGAAVIAWCESLERRLEALDFKSDQGQKIARAALRGIAQQAAAKSHDYDTARQLFGAWRVVYDELVANHAIQLSAADQAKLAGILERIDARDAFILERDRVKPRCEPPPPVDPTVAIQQQEAVLGKAFVTRVNYNPATFSQVMRALGELTGE